jgi:hypothetical protein
MQDVNEEEEEDEDDIDTDEDEDLEGGQYACEHGLSMQQFTVITA